MRFHYVSHLKHIRKNIIRLRIDVKIRWRCCFKGNNWLNKLTRTNTRLTLSLRFLFKIRVTLNIGKCSTYRVVICRLG